MPAIAKRKPSPTSTKTEFMNFPSEMARGDSTPQKRKLRSDSSPMRAIPISTPMKWTSPRRSANASPNSPSIEIESTLSERRSKLEKPPVKNLLNSLMVKPNWNPKDPEQSRAVKEALHVSTAPSVVVCREDEQKRVLKFCKSCVEEERAGSLYVCGCPGTGKSLSMEKVKKQLVEWAQETGLEEPDVLAINCTSLTNTGDVFTKILGKDHQPRKRSSNSTSALQLLQNSYSQKPNSTGKKMMLIIADELDYLITKDRVVLHDLFMLTTLPFSRCVLIGIANAIDLADRFLPRLQSLNCKPTVITFRAYSKDQIIKILQERLMALPYTVFQPQALELCARKVAAASGDMRKALCVCRSAIDMLDAELRESSNHLNSSSAETFFEQQTLPQADCVKKPEIDVVRIDHMALALSKTFKSPVVDTIQSLPQHQQIILCSAVKLFRGGKKDSTVGELNKSYTDFCKSSLIPAVGIFELSSMCRVLNDQGLLKIGQSREEKFKRVTLKVDEADIIFALQGIRFFRNSLQ
ncbi:cell division control protein 6 homolog B-like [Humulus lupulus]|uniref:cell division control protein 6 homolog B-like n=1 Tax=Humulus lupulus TaxID=3486 RepID=UPI002B413614|nr:cell division control protein 6 homolog B-like [Humulus lupulus]